MNTDFSRSGGPLLFLRKFLKHGTRVASVAPSSPSLAAAMCRHVDPSSPQVLLELGAGTGAVTREIVARMHPESTLIAVELDPDFAGILADRIPEATVWREDVALLPDLLAAARVDRVDAVLSGLPIPSLPHPVLAGVLAGVKDLGWVPFSQLTIMPYVYQRFYQRLFEEVDFEIVPWNLPPGGVYHCFGVKAR